MKLPLGWKSFQLSDVTFESRQRAAKNASLNLSVFGVNNQTGLDTNSRYHAENLDRYKIVKPGMFAYNPMRLNIGSIGYCDQELGTGLVSPDYVVFGCKENLLDSKYLFYCTQEHHWQDWMRRAGAGSVRIRIYYKDIGIYPISLPSLLEQRKIVEILSTWDEAIIKTEYLITVLGKRKKGLMQRLLTGQMRFAEFDNHWSEYKLSKVAKLSAGGTPSTHVPEYWGGEVRWMTSGDIHQKKVYEVENRITQSGLNNSSTKLLPINSVLVALAGQGKTRGTVAINKVELSTNQSVAAIIPQKDILYYEYLFYNLDARYDELRKISTGDGGRGGLNLGLLGSLHLKAPSLSEQKHIADILELCDSEINKMQTYNAQLQQQKKGLMQRLLTGEIRVRV